MREPERTAAELTAHFARAVNSAASEAERRAIGVEFFVELIDECDQAGVTVVTQGRVETQGETSPAVRRTSVLST